MALMARGGADHILLCAWLAIENCLSTSLASWLVRALHCPKSAQSGEFADSSDSVEAFDGWRAAANDQAEAAVAHLAALLL